MATLTLSAPSNASTPSPGPLAAEGPTVWQACLSQLAQELAELGEDPAAFVYLVGRSHFCLFALGEGSAYCLSVFERTRSPLTLSASQRAQMRLTLTHYAYPFAWAGPPAWTCPYCQYQQAGAPVAEPGEQWNCCPGCGGN